VMSMCVDLRPGTAALTGVVSVLHARAAHVEAFDYAVHGGAASIRLSVAMSPDGAARLATQLARRVDVLDVRLLGAAAG
jgi:acetolactate synthase regulatory subunit